MKYKVAIADDHKIIRLGLQAILDMYPDLEIVIEASDGFLLLKALKSQPVDIILLDLKMPYKSGYETLKAIRFTNHTVKILILTMHDEEEFIISTMESGANGYLIKSVEGHEIYTAIISCITTGYYFSTIVSKLILDNKINLNLKY